MRDHFADYVDVSFTAELEEVLDSIANGERDWLDFIRTFYRGDRKHKGLEHLVEDKGRAIEYPVIEVGPDPETGQAIRVRIGRYGPFLQMGESSEDGPRASLPDDLAPADLNVEKAVALLKAKAQGPQSLGTDPQTGLPVYVLFGRFGAYVQLGETPADAGAEKPRRASLDRGQTPDTITLDEALKLLSLPRTLGAGPDGEPIQVNRGRFGPYVKHGDDFRSLDATDDVYTVTLERALALLAQPKRGRAQRGAPKELRALGAHPRSGEPVRMLEGRYGPYVSDGTTNASVPKGTAHEAVTLAQAVALLDAREGSAPSGGRKRTASKKAAPARAAKRAAPARAATAKAAPAGRASKAAKKTGTARARKAAGRRKA
jgi:DNA topoisomerase-1